MCELIRSNLFHRIATAPTNHDNLIVILNALFDEKIFVKNCVHVFCWKKKRICKKNLIEREIFQFYAHFVKLK